MKDKIICQAELMKLQLDSTLPTEDLLAQAVLQFREKYREEKRSSPPRLPTTCRRRYGNYDGETQYYYFLLLIKDTLAQIRKGRTAYIFDLWQVREVIRYEPDAQFTYLPDSESIAVRL